MKFTNEIFDRYMNTEDSKHQAMADEFGYENIADFEEDIYIWAVNHGDKAKVMKCFSMGEMRYREARILWADEMERGTK